MHWYFHQEMHFLVVLVIALLTHCTANNKVFGVESAATTFLSQALARTTAQGFGPLEETRPL